MLANSPEVEAPRRGNVKTERNKERKRKEIQKKEKFDAWANTGLTCVFWLDVIPYPLSRQRCIL